MDDTTALKRLNLLLKEPGALKIINHFHACTEELVTDQMVAADPSRRDACAAYAKEHGHVTGLPGGYRSAGHYRLHDVKRIEESTSKDGYFIAYADDDLGTRTAGRPAALLARLTEHEKE